MYDSSDAEDMLRAWRERSLDSVLRLCRVVVPVGVVLAIALRPDQRLSPFVFVLLALALAFLLLGSVALKPRLRAWLMVGALQLAAVLALPFTGLMPGTALVALVAAILASIFLDRRAMLALLAISPLAYAGVGYLVTSGYVAYDDRLSNPQMLMNWIRSGGTIAIVSGLAAIVVYELIAHVEQGYRAVTEINATLEQRVAERTAQLALSNKELQSFSYSVSHDLRAPLRGIDGWSQALAEDYAPKLDERGREYIDRVRSEAHRMGQLIDDLLAFAKTAQSAVAMTKVDLSAIAGDVVARLREHDPVRKVDCVIEPGLVVHGDDALLRVALTNLLDNAWKFTGKREQARIELGATHEDGARAFFVRDDGAGFDMAAATNLFAPFQRMHRAKDFPGNGVGLATVQRIVHRHGGRLWVQSQRDHGTTFFFTLESAQ